MITDVVLGTNSLESVEAFKLIDDMKDTYVGFKDNIETIAKFCNYLIHPTTIFIDGWNWLVDSSHTIFLAISMMALILYITGNKRFKKYIPSSVIVFAFIQMIGKFTE